MENPHLSRPSDNIDTTNPIPITFHVQYPSHQRIIITKNKPPIDIKTHLTEQHKCVATTLREVTNVVKNLTSKIGITTPLSTPCSTPLWTNGEGSPISLKDYTDQAFHINPNPNSPSIFAAGPLYRPSRETLNVLRSTPLTIRMQFGIVAPPNETLSTVLRQLHEVFPPLHTGKATIKCIEGVQVSIAMAPLISPGAPVCSAPTLPASLINAFIKPSNKYCDQILDQLSILPDVEAQFERILNALQSIPDAPKLLDVPELRLRENYCLVPGRKFSPELYSSSGELLVSLRGAFYILAADRATLHLIYELFAYYNALLLSTARNHLSIHSIIGLRPTLPVTFLNTNYPELNERLNQLNGEITNTFVNALSFQEESEIRLGRSRDGNISTRPIELKGSPNNLDEPLFNFGTNIRYSIGDMLACLATKNDGPNKSVIQAVVPINAVSAPHGDDRSYIFVTRSEEEKRRAQDVVNHLRAERDSDESDIKDIFERSPPKPRLPPQDTPVKLRASGVWEVIASTISKAREEMGEDPPFLAKACSFRRDAKRGRENMKESTVSKNGLNDAVPNSGERDIAKRNKTDQAKQQKVQVASSKRKTLQTQNNPQEKQSGSAPQHRREGNIQGSGEGGGKPDKGVVDNKNGMRGYGNSELPTHALAVTVIPSPIRSPTPISVEKADDSTDVGAETEDNKTKKLKETHQGGNEGTSPSTSREPDKEASPTQGGSVGTEEGGARSHTDCINNKNLPTPTRRIRMSGTTPVIGGSFNMLADNDDEMEKDEEEREPSGGDEGVGKGYKTPPSSSGDNSQK